MEIRLVELKDKEGVLKLLDELGEEVNRKIGYSEHNKEAEQLGGPIFEEIVSRKDTFIFIASVNGEIVGLITLYFLPNMRHGWHRGHIEDFIVSEKVRGQGIGTKLFETVKKYCKDNNVSVIKLDSSNELTEAHKFYEDNGGKQTEKMFRFDLEEK